MYVGDSSNSPVEQMSVKKYSQTSLQVMRVKPTITKSTEPYTFGCDITGMDAQSTGFAVQATVNQTGFNAGAVALSGYFNLSSEF